MGKRLSKFQKQVRSVMSFRNQSPEKLMKAFKTGKGASLQNTVLGMEGFKPSMSLAKTLRMKTPNLKKRAIKEAQKRDIALIQTPGTFQHRYMYNQNYVDEYGTLLASKKKVLNVWAGDDLEKAYFNLDVSPFKTERELAKYFIIRNTTQGIDIELTNRYVNMINTINKNFDIDEAKLINETIDNVVNGLNTNDRRWFLSMLDTGQNGFSIKVIYEIANQIGVTDEQKKSEILSKFNLAIKRTQKLKSNKRFVLADLVENTNYENQQK